MDVKIWFFKVQEIITKDVCWLMDTDIRKTN